MPSFLIGLAKEAFELAKALEAFLPSTNSVHFLDYHSLTNLPSDPIKIATPHKHSTSTNTISSRPAVFFTKLVRPCANEIFLGVIHDYQPSHFERVCKME